MVRYNYYNNIYTYIYINSQLAPIGLGRILHTSLASLTAISLFMFARRLRVLLIFSILYPSKAPSTDGHKTTDLVF